MKARKISAAILPKMLEYNHVETGVTHAESLCTTLAAVAYDSNSFAVQNAEISVVIMKNLHFAHFYQPP